MPIAGKSNFFPEEEFPFPKPLIEFNGKTMIEHVIENYYSIIDKKFIFVLGNEDCKRHHLDKVLNLITDKQASHIIKLDKETKGAACSAMMAIELINNEDPLIISNSDQIINEDINKIINKFMSYDAGVITFKSVHPRWSYVRVNEYNEVLETAEKRPLSDNAIAGFYFFRRGKDFINAASMMIKKNANVNGLFYIAPSLNEMILDNKTIIFHQVSNKNYYTFYTPQKIHEFENEGLQKLKKNK